MTPAVRDGSSYKHHRGSRSPASIMLVAWRERRLSRNDASGFRRGSTACWSCPRSCDRATCAPCSRYLPISCACISLVDARSLPRRRCSSPLLRHRHRHHHRHRLHSRPAPRRRRWRLRQWPRTPRCPRRLLRLQSSKVHRRTRPSRRLVGWPAQHRAGRSFLSFLSLLLI